jgi:hypothetical protein
MGAETDVEEARRARGFLDVRQTAALARRGIIVLEPHTTLVTAAAVLEPGVVLWPGTIVEVGTGGGIAIGAGTVLFPGTRIAAPAGRVSIGRHAEIGEEGGFTIKADAAEVTITIGDHTRLLGGGSLTSSNDIGDGAQVLGPIRMQGCCLGAGGSYRDPEPDRRGGVLKGSGVARAIEVPQGHVIQAFGLFAEAPMRKQSFFHPTPEVAGR